MSWLAIIGLILNVVGSFVFILDSNRLSGLLAKMVGHMAEGHGKFDSKSFSKEEIQELEHKISASKKLTYLGYTLFIGGFALQLLAVMCSK